MHGAMSLRSTTFPLASRVGGSVSTVQVPSALCVTATGSPSPAARVVHDTYRLLRDAERVAGTLLLRRRGHRKREAAINGSGLGGGRVPRSVADLGAGVAGTGPGHA